MHLSDLKALAQVYPDFPRPGILFRDIGGILESPEAMRLLLDFFRESLAGYAPDMVAGVEARGFLLSTLLAQHLGVGSCMIRKSGKLPGRTYRRAYGLEYGEAALELQQDRDLQGKKLLLADDVLATGGTLAAAAGLLEQAGARVCCAAVVFELTALNGRGALPFPVIAAQGV